MRIQTIAKIITSRWIIFSVIAWATLMAIAVSVIVSYLHGESLRAQKIELTKEIEILTIKKNCIENEIQELDLEDKKLSMILADLLSASTISGASLGETQIANVIENEQYRALPVTISIKGTYNQIGRFVNLLEKNLQFKIVDVHLSTKETKGAGIIGTIKADFVII